MKNFEEEENNESSIVIDEAPSTSLLSENEGESLEQQPSKQPEFRILQQEYNQKEGRSVLKEVGVAWKNISKDGKEFYTIKIGNLRLLMFKNQRLR
ncbi:MAG: hypothetical protein ACK4J0_00065 [Candidatus Anstonellaceae archaeon]